MSVTDRLQSKGYDMNVQAFRHFYEYHFAENRSEPEPPPPWPAHLQMVGAR